MTDAPAAFGVSYCTAARDGIRDSGTMKITCTIFGTRLLVTLVSTPPQAAEAVQETVAQKAAAGAGKAKDVVVETAKTVADKTKAGLSKTGEVMTDAWITTRVHQRFVGVDVLKNSDIRVDVNNHVVTLKGTVMTKTGRAKAASVALGAEGVRRVVNKLTVGPKQTK